MRLAPLATAHQSQPSFTGAPTTHIPNTSTAVPFLNLQIPIRAAPLSTTHVTNPTTLLHNPFSANFAAPSATTPQDANLADGLQPPQGNSRTTLHLPHQDVISAPLAHPCPAQGVSSVNASELQTEDSSPPAEDAPPLNQSAHSVTSLNTSQNPATPQRNLITTHSLNLRPAQSTHRTNVNTITVVSSPPRLPASSPATQVSESVTPNQVNPTDFPRTF